MKYRLIIGSGKMIFSMRKKFDEKGYYWNREERGWMKTIIGLDKTKKSGYSLIGDFVNAGTNKNDYEAGLYLNCNKGGGKIVYQLLKVTEDEDIELLQELVDPGRGWAVEFWEKIDENLGDINLAPSYPDRFLNRNHLYAYLESIGYAHASVSALKNAIKDIDASDFNVCRGISKFNAEVKWICKHFMSECSLDDIDCEEIKEPNNLLNLTYLEMFKSDGSAFILNGRTNKKYFNRQRMILIFTKKDKIHIRWFNHVLS